MRDFSFQGRIFLGERLSGARLSNPIWVGDQSSCDLNLSTESEDRTETYSGQRLQSARLRTGTTVGLNIVLRYFNAHNLQLGLYATPNNIVSGTVTDEEFPSGLAAGAQVLLDRPAGVADLVIEDSADPSPAELVEGTHYRRSAGSGLVELLDVAAFDQPFLASYDHDAFTSLPLFTAQPPERYLYLEGINTLTGEAIRAHIYRVQFNPVENLGFINPSFGELSLSGTALFDPDAAANDELGGFGRIEIPTETA